MSITFPRRQVAQLQELAARVLESRAMECENDVLAREMLAGFFDVCMRAGLDGVLVELEGAFAPLAIADAFALAEEPRLRADLVARLGDKSAFDARGPRNAKPRQLAECLVAALTLTIADPPDRTIGLTDAARRTVTAAIASVVDVELGAPRFRESVIATARGQCGPHYLKAFEKITAQLDERGLRIPPQPKLALDAVQAVQRMLAEARTTVVERAAQVAIDRAKQALAPVSAEAAERIDQPISHQLTPRDVAVRRVGDARGPRAPEAVVQSLFESLTELAALAWAPAEQIARPYAASQTFAVGDVLDHPKFGRGTVRASDTKRIEVEFAEVTHTLVHARGT